MLSLKTAATLGGLFLLAEALASPFLDPHWGYHALNAPLSVFVALAAWAMLKGEPAARTRIARVGAWIVIVAGIIVAAGDVLAVALEAPGIAASPGWAEGITHTFALAFFLGLAILGLAVAACADRLRVPMGLVGIGSLAAVVMVLAGFDAPWLFAVPEALAGIGLAWAGLGART